MKIICKGEKFMKNSKTIVEMYRQILENYSLTEEEVTFLNGRIAQCEKKNASKSGELSETQKENLVLANEILKFVSENGTVTIAQVRKHFDLSPQKVTPIMTSLVNDEKLSKVVEKRVSYFTATVNVAPVK